ncbi:NEL-type E3 ubiquitin ligase domain-containing protein [Pseudomonas sp. CFBP 13719]|uniref:NEL-type E3 ubiquitin ligase domain-containing protein n=1 Tax=Pseudomonas sp. CFBP 13719 TaxID=2775303 RepID=UPI001784022A|nr:NEL-type E3 ubiquitin ligase domain-containing protein [Pseudomonas sp. CFBP 13719]MBD8684601.1 hypothetical protein [Pseudomonas sp. CFBP 13719]
MPATPSKHLTRQYETLVSPLESADQPPWLERASAEQRRQLQEHHARSWQARQRATQAFGTLQSLYRFIRSNLSSTDWASVTPNDVWAVQHRLSLDEQYFAYLRSASTTSVLRAAMQDAYQAILQEETTLASIREHIGRPGRRMLDWLIDGFATGSAEFAQQGLYVDEQAVQIGSLQLFNEVAAPEIIVLGADDDAAPCVAYIPGHPLHPLKQYPSRASFFASVRRELLDARFQHFFSRFIALSDLPRVTARWLDPDTVSQLPMRAPILSQGLRLHLRQNREKRLLADAAVLIPTSAQAAARLQQQCPSFARLIQQHLILGAGVGVGAAEEPEGRQPSDWMMPMSDVRVGADRRCWLPALGEYRLTDAEAPAGRPDERGLYRLAAGQAIKINQGFYRVEKDATGQWRIAHPQASHAYLPLLRHNDKGAWYHQHEKPEHWKRLSLLRRLGPLSDGFDDQRLLEVARISGVGNDPLRSVYLAGKPIPMLVNYALKRARIIDDVAQIIERISKGLPVPEGYDVPQLRAFYHATARRQTQPEQALSRKRRGDPTPPPCQQPSACTAAPVPPLEVDLDLLHWSMLLHRAILAHRFELAEIPADRATRELRRRYPAIPLQLAQLFIDDNREAVAASLQTPDAVLPLDVAQQARQLEQDARLIHALEGFTVPSTLNNDTFILAVRLLEYLDGWQPGTALLLRDGGRSGAPLAELGTTDVDTVSVYRDDEEGWYTVGADQVLLPQDLSEYGFYRALLHALSPHQRTAIGVGINEPERLHQRLSEMALTRRTRAQTLLNLPVPRTWLSPTPGTVARRDAWPRETEMFDRDPATARLERLFTPTSSAFMTSTAEDYLGYLLQHNVPIGPMLARLEQERPRLLASAGSWAEQGTAGYMRRERERAVDDLLHAWEARIALRPASLHLTEGDLGALPPLDIDLPAVEYLRLVGFQRLDNLESMLRHMPNLRRLELINLPMTVLPEALSSLHNLRLLDLSRSNLAPEAIAAVGTLRHLQTLVLNDMQLPDFSWTHQQVRRLTASGSLHTLTLQNSRAGFEAGVFAVLASRRSLHTLNLTQNLIILSAADARDLATMVQLRVLDLSNNPLIPGQLFNSEEHVPGAGQGISTAPVTLDLSRLGLLEELDLSASNLDHWPVGLESLPRLHHADLSHLNIASVPPGAGSTPGLCLYSASLPEPLRSRFEAEMRTVGNVYLEPEPSESMDSEWSPRSLISPLSPGESITARNEQTLRDAPRLFTGFPADQLQQANQLLDDTDPAAADFFRLLLRLDVSAQARLPGTNMRARIQVVIRGACNHRQLRAQLYEQAQDAVSCVDRDALIFSSMANLARVYALLEQTCDESAIPAVIAMARQDWREARVRDYVMLHIGRWGEQGHVIDDVEIVLYFCMALAERLDLSNPPLVQAFTSYTLWVTQSMLDAAGNYALERHDDAWIDYVNRQPYWQLFISTACNGQSQAIDRWQRHVAEALDASINEERQPPQLSESERQRLHEVLVNSGQLGPLAPLPERLRLSDTEQHGVSSYNLAYAALLESVSQARLQLTRSILQASPPGPSSRPPTP